jgi:arylsulfatase A
LIVSWPGHAPRRATNDLLCSLLDLMPTSAEIIGAPVPDDIDGISFLPSLLRREQTNRHDLLVWRKEGRHAIRFGDWKAMQSTNATWELYLPGEDPAETNNLAGRRPMVLQSITNRLAEWLQPPPTARK